MKWIIMQELEESNTATPYLIVSDGKRAEELCYKLEKKDEAFIYWCVPCEEE